MYSNVGKLIKRYTEIVVRICYILSALAAASVFIAGIMSENSTTAVISVVVAIIIFCVGYLAAWLWGLFLYAYGEMADRLKNIDEKMECILPGSDDDACISDFACSPSTQRVSHAFCECCGAPLSEDVKFCGQCGMPVQ